MAIDAFRIKRATWGMAYSVFQIIQGLLLHPYQTMRQLVRDKVFVWMMYSPILLWIFALFVWKLFEILLFSVFPYPGFWIFLALWFTVGIGMYQILLLYLMVRFSL